ncbi:MAG: aminomethyltransferase family protein, partial [Gaiellaceae bacterium]
IEWFEWWNAIWGYEIDVVNVTGTLAAVNVAGPRARELMERVSDLPLDAESFRYLDAKQGEVAGVPSLLLRIGFVGELGYEIHFPSVYGEHLLDTFVREGEEFGIAPFGLEPQRILRLEKGHILVGQDTDSESNLLEASMPWILKLDKDDFVGRWSAEHVKGRGLDTRLVGFRIHSDHLPEEGGQIVESGAPVGRVTSARRSEAVGGTIGLAWVPAEKAVEGTSVDVRIDGSLVEAEVTLKPFYDPDGELLRS